MPFTQYATKLIDYLDPSKGHKLIPHFTAAFALTIQLNPRDLKKNSNLIFYENCAKISF